MDEAAIEHHGIDQPPKQIHDDGIINKGDLSFAFWRPLTNEMETLPVLDYSMKQREQ